MKQEMLVKPTAAELVALKNELAAKVSEYINLEDMKAEVNKDYGEQMGELWEQIRGLRIRIKEGE